MYVCLYECVCLYVCIRPISVLVKQYHDALVLLVKQYHDVLVLLAYVLSDKENDH